MMAVDVLPAVLPLVVGLPLDVSYQKQLILELTSGDSLQDSCLTCSCRYKRCCSISIFLLHVGGTLYLSATLQRCCSTADSNILLLTADSGMPAVQLQGAGTCEKHKWQLWHIRCTVYSSDG
jgi:hypothetical protein